jgi:ornithine carbamoyltransferase
MLHITTIKNAFRKATEKENGIIINYHWSVNYNIAQQLFLAMARLGIY